MRHRRFTSWLVLFALLAGSVLPLHAGAHARRGDGPGGDYCTTSGSKPSPTLPERAHADACASCFVCGGGSAGAPNDGTRAAAPIAGTWLPVAAIVLEVRGAPSWVPLARGPPDAA